MLRSEYTPPMDRLKADYMRMREEHFGFSDLYAAEWDRALAEHDRQVAERSWDEGARWAAVECGAVDDERQAWIAPGDNPYTRKEQS